MMSVLILLQLFKKKHQCNSLLFLDFLNAEKLSDEFLIEVLYVLSLGECCNMSPK